MRADMIPNEYAFPQLCGGVVEPDGKNYAKKTIATRYLRESDVVIKTSINRPNCLSSIPHHHHTRLDFGD